MSTPATTIAASPRPRAEPGAPGVPSWPGYAVLLASTSIIVGLLWDISWHRSIGRDSFLTPAHLAIYLGGLTAGLSCGWLVLWTTFAGSDQARAVSVRLWGFRGPLGAWVCIWGTIAMLTSAPFDNWWHNAYGLDVKILSPPHTLLALGMIGIEAGAMLLVLARQNREDLATAGASSRLYAAAAGILLLMVVTMVFEQTAFPNSMHSARFYRVAGMTFPLVMVAAARGARLSWPATTVAGICMGLGLLVSWTLEAFPAVPRLAPIYNPVDRMVPAPFPILLVVPGFLTDLLMRWWGRGRDWRLSILVGCTFVLSLLAVQWYAAEFLISPAARNGFFLGDRWNYNNHLGPWRYEYWDLDADPSGVWSAARFARGVGVAMVLAIASSRLGLWWGSWMRRVQR